MTPSHDAPTRGWALLGIVVIAVNLRPAITAVGPVLPMLGADLALSPFAMGLLGALPVAVFALASSIVGHLVRRCGVERTAVLALSVLALATVLRSWPGPEANLWLGTVLIGAAVAVGNVTVPVIVKRDFPTATPLVTGIYVAVLGIFAGLAAAFAVPLAGASTLSWRLSLGGWALLTVVALAVWVPRSRRARATARARRPSVPAVAGSGLLWRNRDAWLLSAYMGVQSGAFYLSLTWLPAVEQELGFSDVVSGWHMFVLQVFAVGGNLAAPVLMRVGRDERFTATLPGVFMVAGSVGLVAFPGAALVWVGVIGLGTGLSFVVALTLIAVRAGDLHTAPRLSAMAQSLGYTIAAAGLLGAGVVHTLGPSAVPLLIAAVGFATAALGPLVGRNRTIAD